MATELPQDSSDYPSDAAPSLQNPMVAVLPAAIVGGLTWFVSMVLFGAVAARNDWSIKIPWGVSITFGLAAAVGMWFAAVGFLNRRDDRPVSEVLWEGLTVFLKPVASLKLTVALFLLSIFIVLIGTLAQVDSDIWQVINSYFRIQPQQMTMEEAPYVRLDELFVWVSPKLFYPPSFFPENPTFPKGLGWLESVWPQGQPEFKETTGFWFPRGWTIGMLMMLNLFAAHLVRFKLQASGARLWCGLGVIAVGILVTVAMVVGTSSSDGLQGKPIISSSALYHILQVALFILAIPAMYGAVATESEKSNMKLLLGGISVVMLALGTGSLFLSSPQNSAMWDAAMRVVYQQLQGLLAGLVLLVGCIMVFKKRAGVVLLHGGIGLMMVYEALVGTSHVESQMHIAKGEEVNYSIDIRSTELAFVNRSNTSGEEHVTLSMEELIKDGRISDPRLPFDVKLVQWMPNAFFHPKGKDEKLISTYGNLNQRVLDPLPPNVGTDSEQTDIPGAYVQLIRRENPAKKIKRQEIGVILLSALTDLAPALNFTETVEGPLVSIPVDMQVSEEARAQRKPVSEMTDSEAHLAAEQDRIAKEFQEGTLPDIEWEVSLRFVRHYKPFTIHLIDVQKNDYAGTDSPRDYRSVIRLTDKSGQVVLPKHDVWMNNPMRFSGETYYQQSVIIKKSDDPKEKDIERTTLQVVKNEGWMAPYVACAIVGLGMIVQFLSTLLRFMKRSQRGGSRVARVEQADGDGDLAAAETSIRNALLHWGLPCLMGLLVLVSVWSFAKKREVYLPVKSTITENAPNVETTATESSQSADENQPAKGQEPVPFLIGEFARIPVFAGGRPVPLDTLAMNQLMQISDRQTFKESVEVEDEQAGPDKSDAKGASPDSTQKTKTKLVTRSAIYWLLQLATDPKKSDTYRIFRIENDEVTKSLGMEVNEERVYAFADFEKEIPSLEKKIGAIQEKAKDERSVFDRKLMAFASNVSKYNDTKRWFLDFRPDLKEIIAQVKDQEGPIAAMQLVTNSPARLADIAKAAKKANVPLMVPTHIGIPDPTASSDPKARDMLPTSVLAKRDWEAYSVATGFQLSDDIFQRDSPPALVKLQEIFEAWRNQNATKFNTHVAEYHTLLEQATPAQMQKDGVVMSLGRTNFEDYFSRFAPFNALSWVYISVFLVTVVGWLLAGFGNPEGSRVANRSGMVMAIVLMLIHTWAIGGRIYISGRPPVTNLYSSAVFIGWATVVAGIIFEMIYKLGIGNLLAAASGFATLRIAHALSSDGDTFGVLQAVLDTQFWLATHVVCITLGYAATFVAGMMGLVYVVGRSRIGMLVTCLIAAVAGFGMSRMSDPTTARLGMTLLPLACIAMILPIRMFMTGQLYLLDDEKHAHLSRMIYGTLCAATALSFIGTVWGGLWADDSWGRFWGWDPKENGALIIVIWNALILHASWDRMVRDRGVAVLAILGNVVTAWSWFGVNELGVGLHAYGFTEGRLFWLAGFCLSQFVIAGAGLIPSGSTPSHRDERLIAEG